MRKTRSCDAPQGTGQQRCSQTVKALTVGGGGRMLSHMSEYLKAGVDRVITLVLGIVGGYILGCFTERRRRRWACRDDFANDVDSIRKELLGLGDNVDQRFVEWQVHSVRKLSMHANYAARHEPKYWRKIEPAWIAYQSACKHKDPAIVLIADQIDTKEILKRLEKLLYEIRAA